MASERLYPSVCTHACTSAETTSAHASLLSVETRADARMCECSSRCACFASMRMHVRHLDVCARDENNEAQYSPSRLDLLRSRIAIRIPRLSRCTILSRLNMEHTEAIHRTRRSVFSDGLTGNYYNTSQARARLTLPMAWALPGLSQIYTVNGDFSRKMTYSPDEPYGWTPRLMICGNEVASS